MCLVLHTSRACSSMGVPRAERNLVIACEPSRVKCGGNCLKRASTSHLGCYKGQLPPHQMIDPGGIYSVIPHHGREYSIMLDYDRLCSSMGCLASSMLVCNTTHYVPGNHPQPLGPVYHLASSSSRTLETSTSRFGLCVCMVGLGWCEELVGNWGGRFEFSTPVT